MKPMHPWQKKMARMCNRTPKVFHSEVFVMVLCVLMISVGPALLIVALGTWDSPLPVNLGPLGVITITPLLAVPLLIIIFGIYTLTLYSTMSVHLLPEVAKERAREKAKKYPGYEKIILNSIEEALVSDDGSELNQLMLRLDRIDRLNKELVTAEGAVFEKRKAISSLKSQVGLS